MQKVQFEAIEVALARGLAWSASYARYIRHEYGDSGASADSRGDSNRATLQLGDGTADAPHDLHKIQFIDEVLPPVIGKPAAKSVKKRRG